MKEQPFLSDLKDYLADQWTALREWLRPVADDPLWLKIIKGILKAVALLFLTAMSPIILIVLIITFLAAF
ncbi:MAG TPA: hypothetical protein VJ953_22385 [Saprospiraceae bacterium]|nr:hypothetical protein [Saprospiraceae bacterium]